jgi:hypothetical protein
VEFVRYAGVVALAAQWTHPIGAVRVASGPDR